MKIIDYFSGQNKEGKKKRIPRMKEKERKKEKHTADEGKGRKERKASEQRGRKTTITLIPRIFLRCSL